MPPRPTAQNAIHFVAFVRAFYLGTFWGCPAQLNKICVVVSLVYQTMFLLSMWFHFKGITWPPVCQLALRPAAGLRRRFFASSCISASAYIIVTVSLLWFRARRTLSMSPYFFNRSTA